MKNRSCPFIMVVGVLLVFAGCVGRMNRSEILPQTQPWHNAYDKQTLSGHVLIYRHTTRDWGGTQSTLKRFINANALWRHSAAGPAGNGNPFGILSALEDTSRAPDIKNVSDDTYSLRVPGGFKLILWNQSIDFDAHATLRMAGGRRQCFTFDALTEGHPTVQKLQIVYRWGFHRQEWGEFWVPLEILSQIVIRRGGVERTLSQRWTLETIEKVEKSKTDVQDRGFSFETNR